MTSDHQNAAVTPKIQYKRISPKRVQRIRMDTGLLSKTDCQLIIIPTEPHMVVSEILTKVLAEAKRGLSITKK